ncbi:MAG: hypothetical protein AB7Q23_02450 [Hyphomonadaceae bacterium]
MNEAVAALRAALEEARGKLLAGDAPEAERHARAVSAMARAERDLAALAAASGVAMDEDDEAMRAELKRRFDLFLDADRQGSSAEELGRLAREMFTE